MKKIVTLVILVFLLFVKGFAQDGWTDIGRTESTQSPYPYNYYLLFDLDSYSGGVLTEIEVMIAADLNYHNVSRYSITLSRWPNTAINKLDGLTMNYISGKPGLLEVLVFADKVWIRSTKRWGTIKYKRSYGTSGNWTIPLTVATIRPGGYLTSSTQPFYYDFDTGNKHAYPSMTPVGNVGIGTDSPDAPLTVKGRIHAEEIKVDLAGALAPDFVFEDDYELRNLDKLENYILKNRHLPGILSAEEMGERGLELKVMSLRLLQKIEELTLYIIDQNKRTSLLEKEIKALTR